jgi:hypothetical protein
MLCRCPPELTTHSHLDYVVYREYEMTAWALANVEHISSHAADTGHLQLLIRSYRMLLILGTCSFWSDLIACCWYWTFAAVEQVLSHAADTGHLQLLRSHRVLLILWHHECLSVQMVYVNQFPRPKVFEINRTYRASCRVTCRIIIRILFTEGGRVRGQVSDSCEHGNELRLP